MKVEIMCILHMITHLVAIFLSCEPKHYAMSIYSLRCTNLFIVSLILSVQDTQIHTYVHQYKYIYSERSREGEDY